MVAFSQTINQGGPTQGAPINPGTPWIGDSKFPDALKPLVLSVNDSCNLLQRIWNSTEVQSIFNQDDLGQLADVIGGLAWICVSDLEQLKYSYSGNTQPNPNIQQKRYEEEMEENEHDKTYYYSQLNNKQYYYPYGAIPYSHDQGKIVYNNDKHLNIFWPQKHEDDRHVHGHNNEKHDNNKPVVITHVQPITPLPNYPFPSNFHNHKRAEEGEDLVNNSNDHDHDHDHDHGRDRNHGFRHGGSCPRYCRKQCGWTTSHCARDRYGRTLRGCQSAWNCGCVCNTAQPVVYSNGALGSTYNNAYGAYNTALNNVGGVAAADYSYYPYGIY